MRTSPSKVALALLICLALSYSLVFAKEGLYGLSFEQDTARAGLTLTQQGFSRDTEAYGYLYIKDDIQVRLFFSAESGLLVSWMGKTEMRDRDIDLWEELIIDELVELHGPELDYDAEYRECWWKLDEYHFLNAGFDPEWENYLIFYGDIREEEYNPF